MYFKGSRGYYSSGVSDDHMPFLMRSKKLFFSIIVHVTPKFRFCDIL